MTELFNQIANFDKSLRSTSTIAAMRADAATATTPKEGAALIAASIVLELFNFTKGRADLAEKLYPARLAQFC